jgi:hypothetical protein
MRTKKQLKIKTSRQVVRHVVMSPCQALIY